VRSGDRRLQSRDRACSGKGDAEIVQGKDVSHGTNICFRGGGNQVVLSDVQMVHFGMSRALIRGLSRDLAGT